MHLFKYLILFTQVLVLTNRFKIYSAISYLSHYIIYLY